MTNRMLQNEFVQYAWAAAPGYELTSWVRDELLVSPEASKLERDLLTSWGWRKKTSVLAPSKQTPRLPRKKPGVVDVEIWAPRYPTQYQMVEAVIADLTHAVGGSPKVSPNHFLVHCGLGSYCPARAPRPLRRPQTALANKMARFDENSETRVVVIDTGYIEKEPLERRRQRGGFDNRLGELWNGEDWVPSPEDDAYLLPDGALDLLDGHGTFTAGQIAERSRKAHITVVGILDEEGAATEAAVARAIYLNADADVILAAFAFPTLHDIEHWVFRGVLPQLKEGSVVVCPAGNGSSVRPHYPAALGWPEYPVVGIGSLVDQSVTDETGTSLSEFSNYGHWVFGYTGGEDVKGLYFDLMAKVEDAEPPDVIWDFNGWASWAGTSFAAPKVAAVLANAAASGTSPREAAEALRAGARRVPLFGQGSAPGLTGYDFRTLAP